MAANIIIVIVWLRMLLQREVSFDQRSVHTPEPPNEKRSAAEAVACKFYLFSKSFKNNQNQSRSIKINQNQ